MHACVCVEKLVYTYLQESYIDNWFNKKYIVLYFNIM
jgi:hypothetical protein